MKRATSKTKKSKNTQRPRRVRRMLLALAGRLLVFGCIALAVLLVYLDRTINQKFDENTWRLPSHVYARPLELYQGRQLTMDQLLWELNALGYRQTTRAFEKGTYALSSSGITLVSRGFTFVDGVEASRTIQLGFSGQRISSVLDQVGKPIAIARLEPLRIGGIYPDHLEDRKLVALDQVPSLLVEGLVSVEDQAFYQHKGISFRGILRAVKADIAAGRFAQGGSTLTQQLIKNMYLSSERTLTRKATELLMAPLLELHHSKDEILEMYLNEVYFGQSGSRSIQGVGLASHYYFGQPLDELDVHQIAFLVGVINGPSIFDPWRREDASLERRNYVLRMMHSQNLISDQDVTYYQARPLDVWPRPARALNPYPNYMSLVRQQVDTQYTEQALTENGLTIFTHLDPLIQRRVESVLDGELTAIESGRGLNTRSLQGAVVVTRVGTGQVVALAGDRNAGFDGFNRALNAQRPIGSLVKPLVYTTALMQPNYSWATPIEDYPFSVRAPDNTIWEPQNYDGEAHGDILMLDGLANSYNLSTARLGLDIGVDKVVGLVRRFDSGISWPEYPAILLGAGLMSPWQVAQVYQTIANDGFQVPLAAIDAVDNNNGQPLQGYRVQSRQVLEAEYAHLIQYGMQFVMIEGTGKSAYNWVDHSIRLAGKTGTTNDSRDSWFAGFGGEFSAVVWVGRDDNAATPLTGATGALRIWSQVMAEIELRSMSFVKPDNIEYLWINRQDGNISDEGCADAILVPFVDGTAPRRRDACVRAQTPKLIDWFNQLFGR